MCIQSKFLYVVFIRIFRIDSFKIFYQYINTLYVIIVLNFVSINTIYL